MKHKLESRLLREISITSDMQMTPSWALKNWCFWIVVLEKPLESPLDCKEIKPVHPKGSQSWIFIGRTDAEAETPTLWQLDGKHWLIGKDPDTGKGWRQEEKGMTENEMVGWHHQLNGYEFEQAPGVGDGQGSLVCCTPCSCRVGHNWATQLNWTGMLLGLQDLTSSTRDLNLCHRLWRLSTMMSSALTSKRQVYYIAGEGTSWVS